MARLYFVSGHYFFCSIPRKYTLHLLFHNLADTQHTLAFDYLDEIHAGSVRRQIYLGIFSCPDFGEDSPILDFYTQTFKKWQ